MSDVSTISAAVEAMADDWALVDDLMGGTLAMRQAARNRMPQWPLEDPAEYVARLAVATLLPAYSETVASMAGRVFAKPIVVGEDMQERIAAEIVPNVDMEGRNLHVFASEWFEVALNHGVAFALVDFPRNDGAKTLADEQASGVRPYWVLVRATQMLGFRSELVNGAHRLVQFRFLESVTEADGEFGEKFVEQVRVLEPGRCRLYRKGDGGWVLHEDFAVSLPEIPLVALYTNRTGYMTAKPPLLELAHLNVKHWQSQSDQDTILHIARVPLLARIGAENDQVDEDGNPRPMQVNKSIIDLPKDGDLKYVEHTGKAIEAGQKSLDELEEQMKVAGAKLLTQTVLSLSESQAEDEQSKEISQLAGMAETMTDAIDQALKLTAEWMKLAGEAGHVSIGADLTQGTTTVQGAETLLKAEAAGIISKETAFGGLKRSGLVPSDTEWEDEQTRINTTPPAPPVKTPEVV
jgi:hypothetical protein